MIVYIIPGKSKTVQDAIEYVCDKEKTAKNFDEMRSEYEVSPEINKNMSFEEFYISTVDGINRALNYIANEDKVEGFISGYLCDPETCEEDFQVTKMVNLKRIGKSIKDDSGNYFYHIIQSFPEGLDISDEEVHRCGVELVERLGLYQAVVCSHIHPVLNEDGEVHGKCKHNHIVMNSHIYHEFVDEGNPYRMKYHNCKETYAQLQLLNDQIAIEHGLPIIDKPDPGKVYSWFESNEKDNGESWKERVRIDVNSAMKTSYDFTSFEESMNAAGYKLHTGKSTKHGQYVTYTCPDPSKIVRDYVLGKGYTRSELEAYWTIRNTIKRECKNNKHEYSNKIERLLEITSEPLKIKFVNEISEGRKKQMREQNIRVRNTYTNYLPLNSPKIHTEAELSYFDPAKTYDIVNSQRRKVTEVSGQDILDYYRSIREREQREKEEAEQEKREARYRDYYSHSGFVKSSTREPYRIGRYDKNGRERSIGELILILAAVIIENEYGYWVLPPGLDLERPEYRNNPIYAKKDWKVQRMIDTIALAREENIGSATEVDERCDLVGKELAKSDAEVRRLTCSIEKMEPLVKSISSYLDVKDLCETLYEMTEGFDKQEMLQLHAEKIETYKRCKAIMYRFKVTSDEEIPDILERFEEYKQKCESAKEQNEKFKQQYKRLKTLQYNLHLAQNEQYCYGPMYKASLDNAIQEAQHKQPQDKNRIKRTDGLER